MKPLRSRLIQKQAEHAIPWEIIERDYLLSWVLAGINKVPALNELLIFKGGTALKKCYFGNYRFSEDLDYSCIGQMPNPTSLARLFGLACEATEALVEVYSPVSVICEPYQVDSPHPRGQQTFNIRAKFPWHRAHMTKVKVEITADERLVTPGVVKNIIHDYGEHLDCGILTYSLEEIVAEKLRAILQNIRFLQQKGWVRSRARDYYDLWRIFTEYKSQLDVTDFITLLNKKCLVRNVTFTDYQSFFNSPLLAIVEATWEQWLGPLLPTLPPFAQVVHSLETQVKEILAK